MKFELTGLLVSAVAEEFPWFSSSFSEYWASIEEPPQKIEADYSLAIAFRIAAQAKQLKQDRSFWEPRNVASILEKALETHSFILLEQSLRGHINVKFSSAWYRSLSTELVNTSGNILSELKWTHFAKEVNIDCPFGIYLLDDQTEVFSSLLEQQKEFLKECGLNLLSSGAPDDRFALKSMMLARKANIELDAKAYRLKLSSSENIPWFFESFFDNWRKFSANTPKDTYCFPDDVSLEPAKVFRVWREDIFQGSLLWWLAQTRSALFVDANCVSADYYRISFTHLISGIRMFSSFYNHPLNRENASNSTRLLVRVMGELVEAAASRIIGK